MLPDGVPHLGSAGGGRSQGHGPGLLTRGDRPTPGAGNHHQYYYQHYHHLHYYQYQYHHYQYHFMVFKEKSSSHWFYINMAAN